MRVMVCTGWLDRLSVGEGVCVCMYVCMYVLCVSVCEGVCEGVCTCV